YHALTRGGPWRMDVTRVEHGFRVDAFSGAAPIFVRARGSEARLEHVWYEQFQLPRESERGLDDREDHLHAGTLRATCGRDSPLRPVVSTEATASIDGEAALERRRDHEASLTARWRASSAATRTAPAWIERLVLAADQFVVGRRRPDDPHGMTVIAGYP